MEKNPTRGYSSATHPGAACAPAAQSAQLAAMAATRGSASARPYSDMFRLVPKGALVISGNISRTNESTALDVVYAINGRTSTLSIIRKGGMS